MKELTRIFGCKGDTKFRDEFGTTFTVDELNEAFLKPTMLLHPDNPESDEMVDLIKWLARFEKVE